MNSGMGCVLFGERSEVAGVDRSIVPRDELSQARGSGGEPALFRDSRHKSERADPHELASGSRSEPERAYHSLVETNPTARSAASPDEHMSRH